MERRLLERVASWTTFQERTNQTQLDVLVASVVDHLVRILNTRQGTVKLDPLFGVPDFTNLTHGMANNAMHKIEDEIRRMVLRYEPRIKMPRVTLNLELSDILAINFSLDGVLDVDQRNIPLRISTTVSANGKINVK